ncbi:SulP family inorganic anion transporter [Magnetospira thiophila]
MTGPSVGGRFDVLRGDLYGGITAAVVALPLALAFGVTSGAGPMAGLYGAILVGFFAALFGGTPTQVSGPTGPMTVVMAVVIIQYQHDPAQAFTVVMMGGALQILFGFLRLGSYISLVPFPVVSGFMSGIGCIIIILQIAPLLGLTNPDGGTIPALLFLPHALSHLNVGATLIGIGALGTMFLTPPGLKRWLPAPLIALILGTLVVAWVLPDVPVLGNIPTGLPEIHLPAFSWDVLSDMLGSALILALLGSIDSLLTSLIADDVTRTRHNSNRELIGQGIGNLLSGFVGGLPGAGATMRTMVNIRAGGTTRTSGMIHSLVLLAVVLGLGPLAAHIPHAVLAGILIKVGIEIIDWDYLRRLRRAPGAGTVLMLLVLFLTVFVDLIMAVSAGMVAASLLFVKRMSDMQLATVKTAGGKGFGAVPMSPAEQTILDRHAEAILWMHMTGPVSFGAAKGLTERLFLEPNVKVLILDLSDVTFVDTSAAMAFEDVILGATSQGRAVFVAGARAPVGEVLDRLHVLATVPANRCVPTREKALIRAAQWLERQINVT